MKAFEYQQAREREYQRTLDEADELESLCSMLKTWCEEKRRTFKGQECGEMLETILDDVIPVYEKMAGRKR